MEVLNIPLSGDRLRRVLLLKCTDSTNLRLKELATNGAPNGQTIIALRQTAGKGSRGRSFFSGTGGLYLSYLLKTRESPERISQLTCCSAVAVRAAICEICGIAPDIKWANDLTLNGRKICGILVEARALPESSETAVIIGIGINVNQNPGDFPQEISETAASIFCETGTFTDISVLAASIITQLDRMGELWQTDCGFYVSEYRKHCCTLGHDIAIKLNDSVTHGFADNIDDQFRLSVQLDNGQQRFFQMGEVSIRPK